MLLWDQQNWIDKMRQFNVIYWDFNDDNPSAYDVLPYFRREYKELKKSLRPKTREEWIAFIKSNGMRRYWARAEYEVIIKQWPPTDKSYKLDIWQQINANIDIIADILMEEYESNSKSNSK